ANPDAGGAWSGGGDGADRARPAAQISNKFEHTRFDPSPPRSLARAARFLKDSQGLFGKPCSRDPFREAKCEMPCNMGVRLVRCLHVEQAAEGLLRGSVTSRLAERLRN